MTLRLNKAQHEAVSACNEHCLVLAGAGSGKTRVISAKIFHLLEKGVRPWQILGITFTNKAAKEMRNRVWQLAGDRAEQVALYTFHAWSASLLRRYGDRISGFERDFSIIDEDDKKRILNELGSDDLHSKKSRSDFIRFVSEAKNQLIKENEEKRLADLDSGVHPIEVCVDLYQQYQEKLRQYKVLDFDDLILYAVELLRDENFLREKSNSLPLYMLVDEYQDTNPAQEKICQLIAKGNAWLTAVGDDDQSIYGFRGARIEHIHEFQKNYKPLKVVKLEQNYRSSPRILDLANQSIKQNLRIYDKELFSELAEGPKPSFKVFTTEREEAQHLCLEILSELEDGITAEEIAIFYRSNVQSRLLEEALNKHKIDYNIFGGLRFYQRKEIKDFIALVQLCLQNDNSFAMGRVLSALKTGIGPKSIEKLITAKEDSGLNFLDLEKSPQQPLKAKARSAFGRLCKAIQNFKTTENYTRDKAWIRLLKDSELEDSIRRSYDSFEAEGRLDNIYSFIDDLKNHSKNGIEELALYLSEINLDSGESSEKKEAIQMMTIHNAKGLEFHSVFVPGLEEETFPHYLSLIGDVTDNIEEERRLFYVAVTRAKQKLVLSASMRKFFRGQIKWPAVSRFIQEVNSEVLEKSETAFSSKQGETTHEENHFFEDNHPFF